MQTLRILFMIDCLVVAIILLYVVIILIEDTIKKIKEEREWNKIIKQINKKRKEK